MKSGRALGSYHEWAALDDELLAIDDAQVAENLRRLRNMMRINAGVSPTTLIFRRDGDTHNALRRMMHCARASRMFTMPGVSVPRNHAGRWSDLSGEIWGMVYGHDRVDNEHTARVAAKMIEGLRQWL